MEVGSPEECSQGPTLNSCIFKSILPPPSRDTHQGCRDCFSHLTGRKFREGAKVNKMPERRQYSMVIKKTDSEIRRPETLTTAEF